MPIVKHQSTSSTGNSQSTEWCGPLSYASIVMSARDAQRSWKEHQQRALLAAVADGNNSSVKN